MLHELLSNAVKYTNEGFVRLSAQIENHQLFLYVEDSGAGIPMSFQNKMFDYFSQLDVSSNRSYEAADWVYPLLKKCLTSWMAPFK